MAYTTINKSSDFFNTLLYTGNGSARTVTGVGFQPDMFWIKNRSNAFSHLLGDTVRGGNYYLTPNSSAVQNNDIGTFASASDGYSLSNDTSFNQNSANIVGWNWKAASTGSGNTGGSGTYKTYTYSVDTTAGFSIIKFQGNGTAGHTIPHHLGVAPDLVFLKRLDNANNWYVWGSAATGIAANQQIELNNTTAAYNPGGNYHNDTRPSSTVITLGDDAGSNGNNNDIMIYAFASKKGYSKIGTYTGNGSNAEGTFVYTGFKPAFVMFKRTSGTGNWQLLDNKRLGYNPLNYTLYPNTNNTDQDEGDIYLLSNGFKLRGTGTDGNGDGSTYMYMAFGQSIVGSNNIPATAW